MKEAGMVSTCRKIPVEGPRKDLLMAAKLAAAHIREHCRGQEASVVLRTLEDAIKGEVGEVLRRYAQELIALKEGR